MTIQEIITKQIEILDEIHLTYKNIDHMNRKTGKCDCENCIKLRSLGNEYEILGLKRRELRQAKTEETDERILEIMTRKYFLLKADLDYMLIEKMMSNKEAADALGVSTGVIQRHCKANGMSYHVIKKERRRRHGLVE